MDLSFLGAGRRFQTLIDVGANDGAYGAYLQTLFSIPRVIAFEPLPDKAAQLRARGFEVHEAALDRTTGEVEFRINAYDAASSLRPVTDVLAAEWPHASEARIVRVRRARLDDLATDLADDVLIKVDAQGAEAEIVEGGARTFERAAAVIVEQTFRPLYEGQALFNDVHARLAACGLSLVGFKSQHVGKDGRPLFAHCVYERLGAASGSQA